MSTNVGRLRSGLNKAEAEQIVEEAKFQGWTREPPENEDDYPEGSAYVAPIMTQAHWDRSKASDQHDFNDDDVCRVCERKRDRMGPHCPGVWVTSRETGRYWVHLRWPTTWHPEYFVSSTDEWRRLKAKVDEIKQVLREAAERGWRVGQYVQKQGSFGMIVEIYPPAISKSYQGSVSAACAHGARCPARSTGSSKAPCPTPSSSKAGDPCASTVPSRARRGSPCCGPVAGQLQAPLSGLERMNDPRC
jgi:hypothetical protein